MNKKIDLRGVLIRKEKPGDYREVEKMIRSAFWNVYKPGCDEHYLTKILRTHEDFLPDLTRIAVCDNKIVGAIFYAKSQIACLNGKHSVITFGPLGVHPNYQRQGIGELLIRETVELAKKSGFKAIIIYGEPDYYPRFGFRRCKEFEIAQPDGTYLDAMMAYELEPGFLKDKKGLFEVSAVYLNIKQEEVQNYDRQFQ